MTPAIRPASLGLFLFLLGCAGSGDEDVDDTTDTDGDGLTDVRESELDTDPNSVDTDEDRLEDGEEVELGTDPLSDDTDGDTYADGDEITEGTDPLDFESRIYVGFWPYCWDKDTIEEGSFAANSADTGTVAPRYMGIDQFGQEVDLYDFAHQGKPIVIDQSSFTCVPCRSLAGWLAGQEDVYVSEEWEPVRDMVMDGELLWITMLYYAADSESEAGLEDVQAWDEEFPNEHVAVMTDPERRFFLAMGIGAWPDLNLLNEDLEWVVVDGDMDNTEFLEAVLSM